MEQFDKIPIVVGVTGHRNICSQDVPSLRRQVSEFLFTLQGICKGFDTPVVMLCGMAQGADMLCAEVAFDLGVPVYAVLPFNKDRFYKTFDPCPDQDKLYGYLNKCERIIEVPDIERNKDKFVNAGDMDEDSYWYRQVGIYLAEHSHTIIALWDGKAPMSQYGCGTVDVIKIAIENDYVNKEHLYAPSMINDSAVLWIKTNRNKEDGTGKYEADTDATEWIAGKYNEPADDTNQAEQDVDQAENADEPKAKPKYYERFNLSKDPPKFWFDMLNKTARYNKARIKQAKQKPNAKQNGKPHYDLWADENQLDGYHKRLRQHYIKADNLSYSVNQVKYNKFLFALALIAAAAALFFLIYDDASLPWMIWPCIGAVAVLTAIVIVGEKKRYHNNYIEYRAFAEALRIQFYLTLCLNEKRNFTNVCDLYSWSQKVEFVWIHKALNTIELASVNEPVLKVDRNEVKKVWIGNSVNPKGQYCYHAKGKVKNGKKDKEHQNLERFIKIATIFMYVIICILEIVALILKNKGIEFFLEGNIFGEVSWRSFLCIIVGTASASAVMLSSYWGKRSYDRLLQDNEDMSNFYASACARWDELANSNYTEEEFARFVKEIAREEIIENGIWCSYVRQNTLDINV